SRIDAAEPCDKEMQAGLRDIHQALPAVSHVRFGVPDSKPDGHDPTVRRVTMPRVDTGKDLASILLPPDRMVKRGVLDRDVGTSPPPIRTASHSSAISQPQKTPAY